MDKKFDKFFKTFGMEFINAFFKFHGIDEKIIFESNADLTSIFGEFRADFVGHSIHGYEVNVEYQKGYPRKEDLKRFWNYSATIHMKYDNRVAGYIFTGAKTSKTRLSYDANVFSSTDFIVIPLVNTDADKILNNIKIKVKNNEKLTEEDVLFLKAGYISDIDKIFERLMETVDIVNNITTLKKSEIKLIKFFYDIIAKAFLTDFEYIKLKERLDMGVSFYDDTYNKGIEIGKDQGIDEGIDIGISRVASNLIKDGQSNEYISKMTGLSFDEIDEIRK